MGRQVLNDAGLLDFTEQENVEGEFYISHSLFNASGGRLTFDSSATGKWTFGNSAFEFDWNMDNGQLNIVVLDDQLATYDRNGGSCQYYRPGQQSGEYYCAPVLAALTFKKLPTSPTKTLTVLHESLLDTTYFTPAIGGPKQIEYEVPRARYQVSPYQNKQHTLRAESVINIGEEYSIPLYQHINNHYYPSGANFSFSVSAVKVRFFGDPASGGELELLYPTTDGTGNYDAQTVNGNWIVGVDNTVSITALDGNFSLAVNLAFLSKNQQVVTTSSYLTNTSSRNASSHGLTLVQDDESLAPASTEEFAGIYSWNDPDYPNLNNFWFELGADGTAKTYHSNDDDEDGAISASEITLYPGYWKISDQGNIIIRRYRDLVSREYCRPSDFVPAQNETCILYHEREWQIYDFSPGESAESYHLYQVWALYNLVPYPTVDTYSGIDDLFTIRYNNKLFKWQSSPFKPSQE